MSLANIKIGEAIEPQAIELVDDKEFSLKITTLDMKVAKSGVDMVRAILKIEDEDNISPVFHYMLLPSSNDNAEVANMRLLNIQRFCDAFNISYDEFIEENLANFVGDTTSAVLKFNPEDDYAASNSVKKFI